MNQIRKQHDAWGFACYLYHTGFLLGLLLDTEWIKNPHSEVRMKGADIRFGPILVAVIHFKGLLCT
jgi:hypothetical protein